MSTLLIICTILGGIVALFTILSVLTPTRPTVVAAITSADCTSARITANERYLLSPWVLEVARGVQPSAPLAMSDFPSMAHHLPVLTVPDVAGWARWLQDHGERSDGVWLVLAKKGTSKPTNLIYDGALAEAICHGWVDGQLASGDEKTFRRKFTPRRPRSRWSKRNVAIAMKMIEEGRMRSSGLAAISSAQADGSWDAAYASQANMEVPPDLASALAAAPEAKTMFARLERGEPVLDPLSNCDR